MWIGAPPHGKQLTQNKSQRLEYCFRVLSTISRWKGPNHAMETVESARVWIAHLICFVWNSLTQWCNASDNIQDSLGHVQSNQLTIFLFQNSARGLGFKPENRPNFRVAHFRADFRFNHAAPASVRVASRRTLFVLQLDGTRNRKTDPWLQTIF